MTDIIGPFVLLDEPNPFVFIEYDASNAAVFSYNQKIERIHHSGDEFYVFDVAKQQKIWLKIRDKKVFRQALQSNGTLVPALEVYNQDQAITRSINLHLSRDAKQSIETTLRAKSIPPIIELYQSTENFRLPLLKGRDYEVINEQITNLFASTNTQNQNLIRYWMARAIVTGEPIKGLPIDAETQDVLAAKCHEFRFSYLDPSSPSPHAYVKGMIQNIFVSIMLELNGHLPELHQFPQPDYYRLIKQKIVQWAQKHTTQNSSLIQFIAKSQMNKASLLEAIKHMAKQRQHRNASKFNALWFQGRDNQIVQPLYNYIVTNESTLYFNQDFFEFLQSLDETPRDAQEISATEAREFIRNFATQLKPIIGNSRGLAKIVKLIESQATIDVQSTITAMHHIACNRQHRCWSKLSIFGKGRDTELVQPLYDLMAHKDFKLTPFFIQKINELLIKKSPAQAHSC